MADNFSGLLRDVYRLYSMWPQVSDDLVVRFAKEAHGMNLLATDVQQIRKAGGLDNEKFRTLGRTIVAWTVAQELSTFGYRGRTLDKLVLACLTACEKIAMGKFSTVLISEWVQDVYEELSPYSNQPIKIRVFATEKAAELRELLGCDQLPQTSSRG